jgi:hypothetical protein
VDPVGSAGRRGHQVGGEGVHFSAQGGKIYGERMAARLAQAESGAGWITWAVAAAIAGYLLLR